MSLCLSGWIDVCIYVCMGAWVGDKQSPAHTVYVLCAGPSSLAFAPPATATSLVCARQTPRHTHCTCPRPWTCPPTQSPHPVPGFEAAGPPAALRLHPQVPARKAADTPARAALAPPPRRSAACTRGSGGVASQRWLQRRAPRPTRWRDCCRRRLHRHTRCPRSSTPAPVSAALVRQRPRRQRRRPSCAPPQSLPSPRRRSPRVSRQAGSGTGPR